MSTIHTDVAADTNTASSYEDGDDAFLSHLGFDPADEDAPQKKRKPSEEVENEDDSEAPKEEAEDDEASEETPETEGEEGETEEAEEKPKDKKYVDSDETYVKVKIGDEEKEVSVKDLKRLYGQEASLTRKSQEVADQRKAADEGIAKNVAALNVLHEKAKAKAAPYQNIDWLAVSKNPAISAADASALRDEAKAAFDDVAFFEKDLGTLMTTISDKQKANNVAQAKVCISSLSTEGTAEKPNPLYIEGWSDKVYDDLRAFAREMGSDANTINALVDPVAFKLLHMAMQFKRGSSKVLTVKTKKSPTKIVKSSGSPASSSTTPTQTARNKAVSKLGKSGSDEDGVNAFMVGLTASRD
jgi:hypothetical protein